MLNEENKAKHKVKQPGVYMRTFGCQMNVRDSEVIIGLLKRAGFKICACDQDADIIIFNTCAVRKHAEDRIWSLIGSYKGSKVIGLVGCMAQNYKEQAFQREASIKFVVGPQDIAKLPEVINKALNCRSIGTGTVPENRGQSLFLRKIWETDGKLRPEEIYHTGYYQDKEHAYVVISEGCSNFCSYCVVPHVRGPLRHRKSRDILKEAQAAVASGVIKITLLGQNVNAYKDEGIDFIKLLREINAIAGLKELGFFTSHPKDVSNDFFKAINDLDRLVKTLHLPVQSGSDRILELMHRGYSRKEYLALIDSYRKIVKGGQLTTDIIVGFPTETEVDFDQTYDLVKKARFNAAYIFKYSSRPGTLAAKINHQLKLGQLEKRHKKILDLQRGISGELRSKKTNAKK